MSIPEHDHSGLRPVDMPPELAAALAEAAADPEPFSVPSAGDPDPCPQHGAPHVCTRMTGAMVAVYACGCEVML